MGGERKMYLCHIDIKRDTQDLFEIIQYLDNIDARYIVVDFLKYHIYIYMLLHINILLQIFKNI